MRLHYRISLRWKDRICPLSQDRPGGLCWLAGFPLPWTQRRSVRAEEIEIIWENRTTFVGRRWALTAGQGNHRWDSVKLPYVAGAANVGFSEESIGLGGTDVDGRATRPGAA
jgi:hypothetical protein